MEYLEETRPRCCKIWQPEGAVCGIKQELDHAFVEFFRKKKVL